MRKIVNALMEYRVSQLKTAGQVDRIGEVRDMFHVLDNSLSHVPTGNDGSFDNPETKLLEVMTTNDFTYALVEFVQRRMIPGYTRKRFAFEPLIRMDTTPNYLPVTRYQKRAGVDDLEYVGEKGEARPGSVDDAVKKQYRVYKWQKQFDFSSEALINDDMGYFSSQASDMGQAARRTLEKFVSRMYTNATTIARLVALGALYSTTGRLTTQRISTARMAFAQRTDARGENIVAGLNYVVHHTGLTDTVATIQNSMLVPELATNGANVVAGTFQPIEDPYITGTAPNLPWYAFTRWQDDNIAPFVLARRDGMPAPIIARKKSDMETFASFDMSGAPVSPMMGDFATGNVMVKVMDEWGTYVDDTEGNLVDYRGAYYSAGTAA